VLQKDLHLGNFLLEGEKVYAFDAGEIQIRSRSINRRKSIRQLASLINSELDLQNNFGKIFEGYMSVRGWSIKKPDQEYFEKSLVRERKKSIRRALKKLQRTSQRYLRITEDSYRGVIERQFSDKVVPAEFFRQIDALMDKGQILKNGRTCYVSRIKYGDRDIVVKRYNYKGIVHSIRHTLKGSRAKKCWLNGHRLGILNIDTPRPLAFFEKRKGPVLWKSYLVTEYTDGQILNEYFKENKENSELCTEIINQFKRLLDKLCEYGISHGDLKHTNVILTEHGLVLTDLDGMKSHLLNLTCRKQNQKDFEDFKRRI
jgi:tRNA A-37 threonylcarbamoyl transferase component Bud32